MPPAFTSFALPTAPITPEIEASRARHRSPLVWRCVQDHLRGQRFDLSAVVLDPSAAGDRLA